MLIEHFHFVSKQSMPRLVEKNSKAHYYVCFDKKSRRTYAFDTKPDVD